jgi:hypothetical protein
VVSDFNVVNGLENGKSLANGGHTDTFEGFGIQHAKNIA